VKRACPRCGATDCTRHAPPRSHGRSPSSELTRTAEYRRNRKLLLADDPDCAICGKPHADTADKIIPASQGGGVGLDNLQPAHLSCNASRQDKPLKQGGGSGSTRRPVPVAATRVHRKKSPAARDLSDT